MVYGATRIMRELCFHQSRLNPNCLSFRLRIVRGLLEKLDWLSDDTTPVGRYGKSRQTQRVQDSCINMMSSSLIWTNTHATYLQAECALDLVLYTWNLVVGYYGIAFPFSLFVPEDACLLRDFSEIRLEIYLSSIHSSLSVIKDHSLRRPHSESAMPRRMVGKVART